MRHSDSGVTGPGVVAPVRSDIADVAAPWWIGRWSVPFDPLPDRLVEDERSKRPSRHLR